MSDQEYIVEPVVLSNEDGVEWVGGPTEVLPSLDEALAALPFDEWKEAHGLAATVVWMVPDDHSTGTYCFACDGGKDCGCWRSGESRDPDAAPFWKLDFNYQPADPTHPEGEKP